MGHAISGLLLIAVGAGLLLNQNIDGLKLHFVRGPWIAALAGAAFVARAAASLISVGIGILMIYLGWTGI